jgi:hypothetical protein
VALVAEALGAAAVAGVVEDFDGGGEGGAEAGAPAAAFGDGGVAGEDDADGRLGGRRRLPTPQEFTCNGEEEGVTT